MRTDACRAAFRTVLLVVVAACAGLPAYAQSARLQITGLEKLASKAAEVVDVTLDGPMLKLASKFIAADEDPDADKTLALIKDLKGIYVKSFEFEREGEYSPEDVEAIRAQLHAPGWVRIVGVHSKRERENTDVYLMSAGSEKAVQGLVIIAAEPKELTVVNIVGPIDLDKLSALEGHMGVPHLEMEKDKSPSKAAGSHEEKK
ncbi:MAG: DUF4252 domain-containing protein [Acidobacteriia bacterium]|nr:DUF4252 domain-containing protein [Terriglobia bacterium]